MNENPQPQYTQLFYDTQLSLNRYHQAIIHLSDAVEKRSSKDKLLIDHIKQMPKDIKDTILDMKTLQHKKLRLFYKQNPSLIEQNYMQRHQKETNDLDVPMTKTGDFEPLKNMVYLKVNLSGSVKKTSTMEGIPLPPWRPNS